MPLFPRPATAGGVTNASGSRGTLTGVTMHVGHSDERHGGKSLTLWTPLGDCGLIATGARLPITNDGPSAVWRARIHADRPFAPTRSKTLAMAQDLARLWR